jgi:hypothetical protein
MLAQPRKVAAPGKLAVVTPIRFCEPWRCSIGQLLEQVLTDENGINRLQNENRNQAPLKFVHAEFSINRQHSKINR